MSEEKKKKEIRKITFPEALVLLIVSIAVIGYGAVTGAYPAGMGLFLATIIVSAYAVLALHYKWDDLFTEMANTVHGVLFGLMFCLSVGFVSASWLASGTIPFMMYWGIRLLNPTIFLLIAFIVCAVASYFTGQAWTMIPSLGIAFIGIAQALGVPLAMAAGAIVSGCFIGDAASPVCEVPTIASICSGTNDVMGTIKSMIPTQGIGILVGIIGYLVLGFTLTVNEGQSEAAITLTNSLAEGFNLNILTLLPVIVVFVLVFMKVSMLPAVTIGSILGILEAVILQGAELGSVIKMMWSGYVCNSGNAELDALLTRGGIMDFAGTIVMLLFAFCFAGAVKKIDMMTTVMERLLKGVKKTGTMIALTTLTTLVGVAFTCSANVNSVVNGNIYKDAYAKMRIAPTNLARTMAMNGSVINAMLPWAGSGAICLSALGVNNFLYWPFMFTFWTALILNIVFAYIGKYTPMLPSEDSTAPEAAQA